MLTTRSTPSRSVCQQGFRRNRLSRLIDPSRLQGGDLMLPRRLADNVETARDGRTAKIAPGGMGAIAGPRPRQRLPWVGEVNLRFGKGRRGRGDRFTGPIQDHSTSRITRLPRQIPQLPAFFYGLPTAPVGRVPCKPRSMPQSLGAESSAAPSACTCRVKLITRSNGSAQSRTGFSLRSGVPRTGGLPTRSLG
jgi:hypothetical protein